MAVDDGPILAPELHAVVLAHQRSRAVESVRGEAAADLALACAEASEVASAALIARCIGVSAGRVKQLIAIGREAAKTKGETK